MKPMYWTFALLLTLSAIAMADNGKLNAMLDHALKQRLSPTAKVEWKLTSPLPAGMAHYDSVSVLPFDIKRSGKRTIWLQSWHRGARGKTFPVTINIVLSDSMVRAKQTVKSGESLDGLVESFFGIVPERDGEAMKDSDWNGRVAARTLTPGKVLDITDTRDPVIVKRNHPVLVVTGESDVAVEVEGMAQMDGRKGDRVAVKTPLSKGTVWGVVESSGRVRIAGRAG